MESHLSENEPPKKGARISWVSWFALLAIIGIIAAVVIPAFPDYTERSQVSEAVSLLGAAKTPLAEYFSDKGKWPLEIGEVHRTTSGKYTASVAISKGAGSDKGEIELTATLRTESTRKDVAGKTVRMLSSDAGMTWTCRPGSVPVKYLPGVCRN